jgi:hypothetical protein
MVVSFMYAGAEDQVENLRVANEAMDKTCSTRILRFSCYEFVRFLTSNTLA